MEGIRGTSHPLDTPLILECIFKNLGVPDLKAFRQLNRTWHEAATKCMRSFVQIKFESEERSVNRAAILRFLELVERKTSTFSTLPFANNFKLSRSCMDIPKFWSFCGSSIRVLDLHRIRFDSADSFCQVIFQSCPNLEHLVLYSICVLGSENEEAPAEPSAWVQPRFPQNKNLKRIQFGRRNPLIGISFLELLSHFPSLEEVDIEPYTREDVSRILKAISTCREHDPQGWNLKSISFSFIEVEEPEVDLRFLLDENLSLETLVVDSVSSAEQDNILRKVLRANATTLKSPLKIDGICGGSLDACFDTMLEKMVDFSLESTMHITSLEFLRNLPNLKKLYFAGCYFPLATEISAQPENEWVVSTCTELAIRGRYYQQEEDLLPLFRRLPNVKKLKLDTCNNELFTGICEHLQNLECLELLCSGVDDCVGLQGWMRRK